MVPAHGIPFCSTKNASVSLRYFSKQLIKFLRFRSIFPMHWLVAWVHKTRISGCFFRDSNTCGFGCLYLDPVVPTEITTTVGDMVFNNSCGSLPFHAPWCGNFKRSPDILVSIFFKQSHPAGSKSPVRIALVPFPLIFRTAEMSFKLFPMSFGISTLQGWISSMIPGSGRLLSASLAKLLKRSRCRADNCRWSC